MIDLFNRGSNHYQFWQVMVPTIFEATCKYWTNTHKVGSKTAMEQFGHQGPPWHLWTCSSTQGILLNSRLFPEEGNQGYVMDLCNRSLHLGRKFPGVQPGQALLHFRSLKVAIKSAILDPILGSSLEPVKALFRARASLHMMLHPVIDRSATPPSSSYIQPAHPPLPNNFLA